MKQQVHEYIIIGSGASGSVIAHELTKAGADVLMLEAGKRFSAATFPDNELDANAQLMWNGGMDASADASTLF
ncbi:MAG: glucose-methanol-choline oxidoreductase, partial [Alcanivorax sp.]